MLRIVLPEKAEAVLRFRAAPELSARIEELAGKSTEGQLIYWSGAAERHEDRKIEDREMEGRFVFLSSIFLSAFVARLRLCRAALTVASGPASARQRPPLRRERFGRHRMKATLRPPLR